MSDYLWDKTGEPEEDVERLEELLGNLRFQPRTFEVPATLPVVARASAPRTLSHSYWSRAAVAASLILTLLAGAWLVATKRRATETKQEMANKASAPRNDATAQQTHEQATQRAADDTGQSGTGELSNTPVKPEEIAAHEDAKRRVVVAQTVSHNNVARVRRDFMARAQKRLGGPQRQLNVREGNAPREEIANNLTAQEREAMEKFLLAMKVTSEKLGYAERQVQGLNESSPQR